VRSKWGESVSGEVRFGLVGLLFFLQAALLVALGAAMVFKFGATAYAGLGPVLIGLGVLYALVVMVALQALGAIFQAGVYLYAATGEVPPTLDRTMVEGAFKAKT
jgi:cytochrome c oxidase subunit IV